MRISVLHEYHLTWSPSQPNFCPGKWKYWLHRIIPKTKSHFLWSAGLPKHKKNGVFVKSIIFGVWFLNRYLLSQSHLPPESLKCVGGQRTNPSIFLEQEWALYFDPLFVSLEGFPGIDISIGVWHHINHNGWSQDDQCRLVGGFKTSQIFRSSFPKANFSSWATKTQIKQCDSFFSGSFRKMICFHFPGCSAPMFQFAGLAWAGRSGAFNCYSYDGACQMARMEMFNEWVWFMSQSLDLVDFQGPIVETNQTAIFGLFFVVQKTDEKGETSTL